MKPLLLVVFSLFAFSAHSLLCRQALGSGLIDPVSFTTLRLSSGALFLLLLARLLQKPVENRRAKGSWISGLALYAHAGSFSFAYVTLSAGNGALILFSAVQLTMLGAAMLSGERMGRMLWLGFLLAMGGLVYLVLPGLEAPDPAGTLLMVIAGMAWGIYSTRGISTRLIAASMLILAGVGMALRKP